MAVVVYYLFCAAKVQTKNKTLIFFFFCELLYEL